MCLSGNIMASIALLDLQGTRCCGVFLRCILVRMARLGSKTLRLYATSH